jgi:simple sugar transport system permease protein
VALAFRCGLFNIGAEGQITIAMLASGAVGIKLSFLPGIILLPLCILAGILAGAIWAGIPGWLKAKRGIHEVINSIMMNYIAFYLVNTLVLSKWLKAPGYQATLEVPKSAWLPQLAGPQVSANVGIFLALIAVAFVYWLLWHSTLGFQIRATGHNPQAAEYAGINVSKQLIVAMLISGGLAGLGGAIQTLGVKHRVYQFFGFINYGFDGLAVALIGHNHPVGVVLASLLFGALSYSSVTIQMMAGVPKQVIGIIQACIIFFVAADEIVKWALKRLSRKKEVVA